MNLPDVARASASVIAVAQLIHLINSFLGKCIRRCYQPLNSASLCTIRMKWALLGSFLIWYSAISEVQSSR